MTTYLHNKRSVVLLAANILLLLPTTLPCQTRCEIPPSTQGFGTRQAWVAVDISHLTPNTAVDPDPTIRPKEIGCHPESRHEPDGRTSTWITDCRGMTTSDQHRAGKIAPDDFYASRGLGVPCLNNLREGVSFYRLPFLIFGRDEADSQGTLRFMEYRGRETWVWYKADTNSFYLLPDANGNYPLFGPFKGNPLIELRMAIRLHRERTLPGVTASAVSHYFYSTHKKPPETPPPSSVQETMRNYTPEMAWRQQWSLWNSSQTTVRLTNDAGRILYYLSKEGALEVEEQQEGGIYAYELRGIWHKLEPGQSVEQRAIFNPGVNLSLSECARRREQAQSFATKRARSAGSPLDPASIYFPCQMTAPTRHVVVFVNTEPVFHDEIPIEITYTPPLRETLPPDAPAVVPAH